MAVTVTNLYTAAQTHFPDIPQAVFLSLLNDVHQEIIENVRLTPDVAVTVNLTAGQQEYALPDTVLRIWEAAYMSEAGDYQKLEQTNVDWLDYNAPTWRNYPPSTPYRVYDRGGNIGFVPAPDTSTSGGYPIVTLYCYQTSDTPLGIEDSLPAMARTGNAWLYRVLERWCDMYHQEQSQFFAGLSAREYERLISYSYGRMSRDKAAVQMRIPRIRY